MLRHATLDDTSLATIVPRCVNTCRSLKLYRQTAELLNLAPSQHTKKVFKQILGDCTSVVEGLEVLRNRLSDSHGTGKAGVKPAPRHAELAVNLAGSLVLHLLSTREAKSSVNG
ncbi:abortive infection family protein [Serratia proteamaculans]|uniref:abortive infection family protein n=1 Tax=Serratia proteamaculans TaxID=28151 RepID=UPI003CFEF304